MHEREAVTVGQSAVALASLGGAERVVVVGAPQSRLEFAKRMGATDVIGLEVPAEERAATVRQLTRGHGADVVIEATGAPDAVSQALDLARDGRPDDEFVALRRQVQERGAGAEPMGRPPLRPAPDPPVDQ